MVSEVGFQPGGCCASDVECVFLVEEENGVVYGEEKSSQIEEDEMLRLA